MFKYALVEHGKVSGAAADIHDGNTRLKILLSHYRR